MQIIRTLGQLGYGNGELAFHFIIGSVFQIELAGANQVSHQAVILLRFKDSFQIEGVLTIGFSSMDVSGIVSIFFFRCVPLTGRIWLYPS